MLFGTHQSASIDWTGSFVLFAAMVDSALVWYVSYVTEQKLAPYTCGTATVSLVRRIQLLLSTTVREMDVPDIFLNLLAKGL